MSKKNKMETNLEFDRFSAVMEKLISVQHADIKAQLDAEKAAKKKRRKAKPSASGRAGGKTD